jgi:hypothetical protein
MGIFMTIAAELHDVVVTDFFGRSLESTRQSPQQGLEEKKGRGEMSE